MNWCYGRGCKQTISCQSSKPLCLPDDVLDDAAGVEVDSVVEIEVAVVEVVTLVVVVVVAAGGVVAV